MKLLVISNMWPGRRKPYWGVFVADRVDAYRRLGLQVAVAANEDPRTGAWRNAAKYLLLTLRSVVAALRLRPDLIEGHFLYPTAVITHWAAAMIRRPYVLYAHGTDVGFPSGSIGTLVDRAVRHAAEVHTNSDDTKDRLAARFPGVAIRVIPPGVAIDRFPPGEMGREPIVVYAGNLEDHKGPDVLLDALAELGTDRWKCRIAGIGSRFDALREQAVELNIDDRIEWLGAVDPRDLGTVYRSARVGVLPSRRDALGQAAIECLASGTPVVVTAVGGLASVPTDGCGSVVPPEDSEALAVAIDRWLKAPIQTPTIETCRDRALDYAIDDAAALAVDRFRVIATGTASM